MNRALQSLPFVFAAVVTFGVATAQDETFRLLPLKPLGSSTVRASGRVIPAWQAQIGARVAGRITVWGVDAAGAPIDVGSHVAKDAELFRVEPTVFQARVATAKAMLATAEARLADLKSGTRPERVAVLAAALAEIDARLDDLRRDEARFRRLVEEDHTMPAKKLEEVRAQIAVAEAQRAAAAARLDEAKAGATATELAVASATVAEARSQLELAEVDLRDTVVKSPREAVVVQRHRTLGDYVNHAPFTEVLTLVSDTDLEAELRLPESDLKRMVARTTTVTLESPLVDGPLDLTVDRTTGTVDPNDGVFAFRAKIPPARRGRLIPGAFVQGVVTLGRSESGVVVPRRALSTEGGQAVVYVARGGVLRRLVVNVAENLSDGVVVREGLTEKDFVAVGPPEKLKDDAPAPESR